MNTPLVSIIVPVYNGERYLEACLNSIRKQTYKNIEVICVDDGSKDYSPHIIQHFCDIDKRFVLLCQQNQHAGVARNYGLSQSHGEFVIFLDADDIFRYDMIRSLVKAAADNNADIVMFNHYYYINSKISATRHLMRLKYQNISKKPSQIADEIFNLDSGIPWNKFYRAAFVRETGIQFQDLVSCNDVYFTKLVSLYANNIYFLNKAFVYYRVANSNSLQGNIQKTPDSFYYALSAIIEELKNRQKFETYRRTTQKMVMDTCLFYLLKSNTPGSMHTVFELSERLFQQAEINDVTYYLDSERASIMESVMNHHYELCIFHIMQYVRNHSNMNTTEYRIGKKMLSVLRLKRYH